ncbi:MAG: STM4014 family protein [Candidatus Lokiarchaeota archaeon]|nr:STM4014 family protein [Candidatus Lokiarchaeota archaeon]
MSLLEKNFKNLNVKDGIVLIGNPNGWRVNYFQKTLAQLRLPPATVVNYKSLIKKEVHLSEYVREGTIVKIESPDQDFKVEKLLLELGAPFIQNEYNHLTIEEIRSLKFDLGRILPQRQWYLGFLILLETIEQQLNGCEQHYLLNHPSDIGLMFDKCNCYKKLSEHEIKMPISLDPVNSYDDLVEKMDEKGLNRAFIKLSNGSSASGVVAYRRIGTKELAITTSEMVRNGSSLKFYNSKRMQVYRETNDIRDLINFICSNKAHAEEWLPKAAIKDHLFDLRVVVIDGKAEHIVPRLSRNPMTNLHLSNKRGRFEDVLKRLGMDEWSSALVTCEKAMSCFPKSFYAGVDLVIIAGFRDHAVLEMNAFGDLLIDPITDTVLPYFQEIKKLFRIEC